MKTILSGLIVLILVHNVSNAQSIDYKNNVSLHLTPAIYNALSENQSDGRNYIQYHRMIGDDLYLKADLSIRLMDNTWWNTTNRSNDTMFTNERHELAFLDQTIRIGLDRRYFDEFVTVGAGLIFGYRNSSRLVHEQKFKVGPNAYYVAQCSPYPGNPNCPTTKTEEGFFMYGTSINLSVNATIQERWMFSLVLEPQYVYFAYHKSDILETTKNPDFPERYAPSKTYNKGKFRNNLNLVTRFRF